MKSWIKKAATAIGKVIRPKIELTPTQKSFIEQVQRGDIIIHETRDLNGTSIRISRNPDSIKIDPELSARLAALCVGARKP